MTCSTSKPPRASLRAKILSRTAPRQCPPSPSFPRPPQRPHQTPTPPLLPPPLQPGGPPFWRPPIQSAAVCPPAVRSACGSSPLASPAPPRSRFAPAAQRWPPSSRTVPSGRCKSPMTRLPTPSSSKSLTTQPPALAPSAGWAESRRARRLRPPRFKRMPRILMGSNSLETSKTMRTSSGLPKMSLPSLGGSNGHHPPRPFDPSAASARERARRGEEEFPY
jgi:hypothetical protein